MNLCCFNQQPSRIHCISNTIGSTPAVNQPVAKDLNLCAVLPDHIADNGCSCTKLLRVNSNEKTEATSHVSLKLSNIHIIAWSTSCLEKFALNLILRSYIFNICIVNKHALFLFSFSFCFLIEEDRTNVQFLRYFKSRRCGTSKTSFNGLLYSVSDYGY